MENYTITKEQILQLENFTLKENVDKNLKIWFPGAFKKELELNKWYKGTFCRDKNPLVYFDSLDGNGNIKSYGFNPEDKWVDYRKMDSHYGELSRIDHWTEATPQEVESALREEAKKRGFKKGITHNVTNGDSNIISSDERFAFVEKHNKLLFNNWAIFENGQWASILPEETKEITMDKAVKILSKKYGKKVIIK